MNERTCCFFGHRTITVTEELVTSLSRTIESLITEEKVNTFLFGSKSEFDSLCLNVVSKYKEIYPIKRVYVRAEYPIISKEYKDYLLTFYDGTYYPRKICGAGRAVYVERNYEVIRRSYFCVFFYDEAYFLSNPKSGTKRALDFAIGNGKKVILIQ
ncbi:MAG: hypothetical protein IJF55_04350 [Clostridia bacterium]|nr:hypothetical protein [Clostridia bacterium]